jgi:hypothetical protein
VRPLTELIETQDPAWPEIEAAVATGSCPVVVLPADAERADEELFRLQVTTRSWLGAVVHHTGGLALDHGWLRVLGSGNVVQHMASLGQLSENTVGKILVAQDVLGGQFAWMAPTSSTPTIHYFAPDTVAILSTVTVYDSNAFRIDTKWKEEVYYREGDQAFFMPAGWGVQPPVLYVPSAGIWDSVVPNWLRGRRTEVVSRLRERSGHVVQDTDEWP